MLVILLVKTRHQQKVLPANNAKQRPTPLRFAMADDSATPARNRSSQALLLSSGHQLWFKRKKAATFFSWTVLLYTQHRMQADHGCILPLEKARGRYRGRSDRL
jgi:hypothetical protein